MFKCLKLFSIELFKNIDLEISDRPQKKFLIPLKIMSDDFFCAIYYMSDIKREFQT